MSYLKPHGARGDLAGMRKRGVIRALVVYSMTNYFLDGGKQRGLSYELLKEFKQQLDKALDEARSRHDIEWVWVRGHDGDPGNEEADALANRGIDEL